MASNRRRRNESGTVALEFALVIPILILVIFSMIDFGRYFYVRVALSSASIEVANAISRGAITDQNEANDIRTLVEKVAPSVASFAQLSGNSQIAIDPLPATCPNGTGMTTVLLTSSFRSISPIATFFSTASASTTMKCLR